MKCSLQMRLMLVVLIIAGCGRSDDSRTAQKVVMNDEQKQAYAQMQQKIATELVRLLPAKCVEATLTLEAPDKGIGEGVSHSITNNTTPGRIIFPDSQLFLVTRDFELASVQYKLFWQKVTIVVKNDGESWQMNSQIEYSD